jgi:antagonist of KipI
MDRFALMAANRLVGNDLGATCVEMLVGGSGLSAEADCLIAITGGDLDPRVNGNEVPGWTGLRLAAGDRLQFGTRRTGARAYLAVSGGLAGDRWLGSQSTNLLVARGGIAGRALHKDDALALAGPPRNAVVGLHLPVAARPTYPSTGLAELAAVPGPQISHLTAESRHLLFRQEFGVHRESDRMGYRLVGETLDVRGPELVSFGLTYGCVQVPASGQPILLMADVQTTGGYPVVAGVVRADLPAAAQLLPGDRLTFRQSDVESGVRRWSALMAGLEAVR